jgi:hypothetical protein
VGDRVLSISSDGKSSIEDEIVMMMHNEPNTSSDYYLS